MRERLNIIEKVLLLDVLRGLAFTMRKFFAKKSTHLYPYMPMQLQPKARGIHYMREKEPGRTACTACKACERACPAYVISIDKMKAPDGKGFMPSKYEIDMSRCIYCGFCEDACPFDAIHMGGSFHTATTNEFNTMNLEELTENYKVYEEEKANGTFAKNFGIYHKFKRKGIKQVTMDGIADV